MPSLTDAAAYWDRYAANAAPTSGDDALRAAFGWTQYDGHGPGHELLGDPRTALELGCGRGDAVAALATAGVHATGVDLSPAHIGQARTRWVS